jgi:hypothetical protein
MVRSETVLVNVLVTGQAVSLLSLVNMEKLRS